MQALGAVCIILTASVLAEAHRYHRPPPQPADVSAGDPCTPRKAATCGDRTLMTTTTTPASESRYGPNVCLYEEMYQTGTYSYEWQQYCPRWGGFCSFVCVRTDECDGEEVNVTQRYTSCCEGFASRSSSPDFDFWSRHHRHRSSYLRSDGCPIELMGNVFDCLESLNLTELVSLIRDTSLMDTLNRTDTSFTFFAPSNEAIEEAEATNPIGGDAVDVFSTHIVEKIVPESRLRHGVVLTPLMDETLLHVTDVYEYGGWGYFRWRASERTFINGAEVIEKDACQSLNGIVHVVDSLIPTSTQSIAEILDDDADFSIFKELLDAAGISDYLNRSNPRTVFAPTDTAFDEFGDGISECLQQSNNSRQLKYLVLSHITCPVEYTSSLSLRSHIAVFSGYYLRVRNISDIVHLTRNEIPLDEIDTPARNGVIHSINTLIVPPCLNLTALCPPSPAPDLLLPPVVDGGNEENPEPPLDDLDPDEMGPTVLGDV